MRVLFWTGSVLPTMGGAQVLAAKLLPALQKRGYEFIVITSTDEIDQPHLTRYNGIPIYRFPFSHPRSYADIEQVAKIRQRIAELKRSFAPELTHIDLISLSDFFYLMTARVHPTPLLVTLHGTWNYLTAGTDSLAGKTLRVADWVVGCSGAILEQGRRLVPETATRSSVIYNAMEVPKVVPTPISVDKPRLLCLGRLANEKGFDLALTAFASASRRFPQARLIIAGDGPARPSLEQQTYELGVTDSVEFLGQVDSEQVPCLLNSVGLVLIPSRQEAFSLVALESAFMERPVVATRVGGIPEVVLHEHTGLLVPPEDSRALAEALTYLLDHPHTAGRMGREARIRAQKRFKWDRYVDSYDALYGFLGQVGLRKHPLEAASIS